MKKITPKQMAELLYVSTKNASEHEASKAVKEVVASMHKHNLISKAENVIQEYRKLINKEKGIKEVTITLQERVGQSKLLYYKKELAQMLNAKDVYIKEKVDQRILGGMLIETDDGLMIDGTLKGRLTRLRKALTN